MPPKQPSKHDILPVAVTALSAEIGEHAEVRELLRRSLLSIREEARDSVYIQEALRVLQVRGYRSAIVSYWNAVVDDLRQKVMHRSLSLFNKEVKPKREIKTYEDMQDVLTDADLIEGSYKIGVIGWEARQLLHQARQVRNIFGGHPKSSEPSAFKVLAMMDDCNKYVLAEEPQPPIVDIDQYITTMDSSSYDRNPAAVEAALAELPEIYTVELINRFYTVYVHPDSSTNLRSNIEFCAPVLWQVLPKATKLQIARRLDKEVQAGDADSTARGFAFVQKVGGMRYATVVARRYVFRPLIESLEANADDWKEENEIVTKLSQLGTSIPSDLLRRYIATLTKTYVGYRGSSLYFARTDFYADGAAPQILSLFESFDDQAVESFVDVVKKDATLRDRIRMPGQLARLRNLAKVLLARPNAREDLAAYLEVLSNEAKTAAFFKTLAT